MYQRATTLSTVYSSYIEPTVTVDGGKGRLNPSRDIFFCKHRRRKVGKSCVTFLMRDPLFCCCDRKWALRRSGRRGDGCTRILCARFLSCSTSLAKNTSTSFSAQRWPSEERRRIATLLTVYCTFDKTVLLFLCLAVDYMKLCLLAIKGVLSNV